MSETILIVEDEPKLAEVLADYLNQAGFDTEHLSDGREVVPLVRQGAPALILLDLMLPGRDGMEICREIRTFCAVPIIMVTARIEEIDRLLGLELGADDYICKPYSPREVVARVRAVLRRTSDKALGHGLELDPNAYLARLDGHTLDLTAVEFKLLQILADRPGRIFARNQLMERIYPDSRVVSDRTIDSHVKKLRRKIEQVAPGRELVRSVYGVGYTLEREE